MTKKVLISLDDYSKLQEEAMEYQEPSLRLMKFMELFLGWFEAQPDAPQWISVGDGLPDHGERVFVRNGDIILALVFNKELNVFMSRASSALHHAVKDVTHWMPIPPLSKIEAT